MKGWKKIIIGCVMLGQFGCLLSAFAEDEVEEVSKWDTAGDKIMEASHAIGEATEDSAIKAKIEADKALEKARKAWESAKQKYEEELEKARAGIHAATAPRNAVETLPHPDDVSGNSIQK